MQTNFDYQKATQAINYLARKGENSQMNKLKIIKLIWAADRFHLRKYGRPVTGAEYVAMSFGPVASSVKDIAESSDFLAEDEKSYSAEFIDQVDSYSIRSLKEVDMDVFSKTDIESLEFALSNFGSLDKFKLVEITHKYPEWKKFETALVSKQSTRETMDYLDFFENPDQFPSDKFQIDPNIIAESKEAYLENTQSQSLL